MSLTFRYFNLNPGGFDVDLGTVVARLGEHGGFSMKAEAGEVGVGEIILDDPDADIGNAGDAILGLQGFEVSESDCDAVGADGVNGVILFSGYTGQRTYSRGDSTRSSLITGAARQIRVALADQNIYATWRINRDGITGNRPAETDVERVQWLISGQPTSSAPFFYVTDDAGWIDTSNPVDMDACDYTGQTAADVLQDCSVASGKNWWIGHWEATGLNSLWYRNSNTSTLYTSLLRISNVLSDVDDVTTFAPEHDAVLTRDPTRVFAGVYAPFPGGYAYQTNATTGDTYGWRDGSAPNANITSQTTADAVALRMVNDATTEDDHISVTVQLPSNLATGIKVGQRIECLFSHLPGYDLWTWFRVTGIQIAQDEKTPFRYTLALELSPQEPSGFSGARVYKSGTQNVSGSQVIEFGSTRYDTSDGDYIDGTTKLVAPEHGMYRVGANLTHWSYGDDSTAKGMWLRKNGTVVLTGTRLDTIYVCVTQQMHVEAVVELQAGDYVEVLAYVNPATTGSGHAAKGYQSCNAEFWMGLVRSL